MAHHTLLLLRHGIAEERRDGLEDGERALTPRGRSRTRAVLDRLVALGLGAERLISSPLLRAVQTAEIAVEAGLAPALEIRAALAPGGDPRPCLPGWLEGEHGTSQPSPRRLLLVGHEPDLSHLAARLLAAPSGCLTLRKAGLLQLALPCLDPLNGGVLELLLRPSALLG
jgi:phosphohistidine phosphatase